MSTSLLDHAFGARGYQYVRTTYSEGQVAFTIRQEPRDCRCPACGAGESVSRGHVERRSRPLPLGSRPTSPALPVPRAECRERGSVRQVEVGSADPPRSYTGAFERSVLGPSRGMTIRDVAPHPGAGWDLVKGLQKRDLSRRFARPKLEHLRRIAIDETAVARGRRYMTAVPDLDSGAVAFAGDGEGAAALKPFWGRLRPSGAKAEAAAMGMSAAYRGAVPARLKGAVIVSDRFRVVKRFNDELSDLRRSLYHRAEADRKEVTKGARWLPLKSPEDLDADKGEKARLEGALALNKPLATAFLPGGGPAAVLGAAGEAVRHGVPERLAEGGGGVRCEDAAADGQDACGAPLGPAGVLRRDGHERADGRDEQQDQDDEAEGLRVPGPRVLRAEDPGDP